MSILIPLHFDAALKNGTWFLIDFPPETFMASALDSASGFVLSSEALAEDVTQKNAQLLKTTAGPS